MQNGTNWKDMPEAEFAKEVDDLLWVIHRTTAARLKVRGLVSAAHAAGWNPWDTVKFIERTDGLL